MKVCFVLNTFLNLSCNLRSPSLTPFFLWYIYFTPFVCFSQNEIKATHLERRLHRSLNLASTILSPSKFSWSAGNSTICGHSQIFWSRVGERFYTCEITYKFVKLNNLCSFGKYLRAGKIVPKSYFTRVQIAYKLFKLKILYSFLEQVFISLWAILHV